MILYVNTFTVECALLRPSAFLDLITKVGQIICNPCSMSIIDFGGLAGGGVGMHVVTFQCSRYYQTILQSCYCLYQLKNLAIQVIGFDIIYVCISS